MIKNYLKQYTRMCFVEPIRKLVMFSYAVVHIKETFEIKFELCLNRKTTRYFIPKIFLLTY